MQVAEIAVLLEAAPVDHQKRCALAHNAIESGRWPQAVCGLRHAAAGSTRLGRPRLLLLLPITRQKQPPCRQVPRLQSRRARRCFQHRGLLGHRQLRHWKPVCLVIANSISRECAIRARRAINGASATAQGLRTAAPVNESPRRAPIPTEAALIGAHLDAESIEQGEPA